MVIFVINWIFFYFPNFHWGLFFTWNSPIDFYNLFSKCWIPESSIIFLRAFNMKKQYASPQWLLSILIILFVSFWFFELKNEIVWEMEDDYLGNNTSKVVQTWVSYVKQERISEVYTIHGMSMEPLILNGERVLVDLDYFRGGKNTIQQGDVIIFENPHSHDRIIKRVGIIAWDRVEKKLENGTLLVNGKVLMNSVLEPYIFDDRAYRWIDIYTKSGIIIENTYFLYGDNIDASVDSRITWPVTLEWILGKVIDQSNSTGTIK